MSAPLPSRDASSPALEEADVAIIGGGPAGLSAGLYAARASRRTILFQGGVLGGQIATAMLVENYPGFADGVNGFDLALAMQTQAERFGMQTVTERVESLRPGEGGFLLNTTAGVYRARAVILAMGADPVHLGVPGEAEYVGRGVSYCATCDAALFRDRPVAVVGGGDAAVDEALFAARFASRVTIIHRRDALRATKILQQRAFAHPRIAFRWDTVVEAIAGGGGVERLELRNTRTGARDSMDVDAVFVCIGQRPNTRLVEGLVSPGPDGYVQVTPWMETSVPGLFAVGDLRIDAARQVATAAGDGVTAAIAADRYLERD